MALNYVEKDAKGDVYEVKVSPKDAPEKFVPLPRAYVDSFSDVSEGFTDDILGKVDAKQALAYFNQGFNLARRSKTVAANSIDKRIDNAVKRWVELSELAGNPMTEEQVRAMLAEKGIA